MTLHSAGASLDENVHLFMKRCEPKGIVLHANKCQHDVTCIPFMGHLLTSDGIKPDPDKVSAIQDMPMPTNMAAI